MTAQLAPTPVFKAFDNNGLPLTFGTLTTYAAGTTTPLATYVDSTQTTQNTNPIILNFRGECNLWLDPTKAYKFLLQDSSGNIVPGWPVDNIPGSIFVNASGSFTLSASLIPTPPNTQTLGNPSFSWAQIYLGANAAPAYDSVSGNIGYYARTAAEISAGVTPVNYAYAPGWISRYGNNASPGTTDMSTALQNAINANKGGFVYIDSICLCAGLQLTDSSYNGTEIRCVGGGELKLKADGGNSNFDGSIWSGILLQNCDRVLLDLRWNGNRAAMTSREGIHCVDICGASNVYCPALHFREIRGDGLYIDHLTPSSSAVLTNATNIVIDYLWAYNSADDGRNACSVISCDGLTIGELHSFQVGGVVATLQMPGGLDLEPNWANDSITDVAVGVLNVVTAGGTGLAIQGIATTNDATRDWNCQRVTIGAARIKLTNGGEFLIRRARNVDCTVDVRHTNSRGIGVYIDYADRVTAKVSAEFCTFGVMVGQNDTVNDAIITMRIDDYNSAGLYSASCNRITYNGRIYNALAAAGAFAIQLSRNARAAFTQTNVVYSVDVPSDGNAIRGWFNGSGSDLVTIGTGTCIANCNMAGWTDAAQVDGVIPSYNVVGRNVGRGSASAPAAGSYAQGDLIELLQSAGSTPPFSYCITSGLAGAAVFKPFANLGP